jgi:hypothetical protein
MNRMFALMLCSPKLHHKLLTYAERLLLTIVIHFRTHVLLAHGLLLTFISVSRQECRPGVSDKISIIVRVFPLPMRCGPLPVALLVFVCMKMELFNHN